MGGGASTPKVAVSSVPPLKLGGWNLANGTYTLYAELPNYISTIDKNGTSSKQVVPSAIVFTPSAVTGLPTTLQAIISLGLDPQYISYAFYVQANGTVSKHDCDQTRTLTVNCYGQSTTGAPLSTAIVARSQSQPNSAGPIDPCAVSAASFDNQCWQQLYNGPTLLTLITTSGSASGSGSACVFSNYGGWSKATVSLLVFVTIRIRDYCTLPGTLNISNDLCYPLMEDYFSKVTTGIEPSTTNYIESYCEAKFPGGDLYTLNQEGKLNVRDTNLCACNMPLSSYQRYASLGDNLQGTQLKCYLGNCINSNFKPAVLSGCPPPMCLNIADLSGSTIQGDTSVKQSAACSNITNTGGGGSGQPTTSESFLTDYQVPILVIVVIIIILIVIGIIYSKKKK